ncbi:hypothetical protein DPEC_G00148840 [Dallia pectoralis]|uniref:Uncharacterized protein n=1 Tax=Dallia pectoralis TaxID=75939 RepID=A0ACC2GIM5_DALPE|nr:hypothetical protein DPEC_G00148840 [Dallia pectoralis]
MGGAFPRDQSSLRWQFNGKQCAIYEEMCYKNQSIAWVSAKALLSFQIRPHCAPQASSEERLGQNANNVKGHEIRIFVEGFTPEQSIIDYPDPTYARRGGQGQTITGRLYKADHHGHKRDHESR